MKKKAERAKQVAKFLKNLYKSSYSDAKDRNPQRVQGTCEWFTGHHRFQDWKDEKTCGLLWVSADPGCGKSVLSRYLVDEVLPSSSTSTTCYFFFKDDFEGQKSAAGALCCVLRQLFKEKPALLQDSILKQYEEDGDKLLGSFRDLWRILVSVSRSQGSGEVVCVLDALDECEKHDRRLLVQTLNDFYLENDTKASLKFLVTSRPYVHIERGFNGIQTKLPMIHLQGEGQSESEKIAREIDLVVEARATQVCKELKLTKDEEKVLKGEMTQNPNRTYLWVYLVFEQLQGFAGHSSTQIKEDIRNIPRTVNDAYEKILSRSPDESKARKLLHIVVAAKRPLNLTEMAVAMSIERDHTLYSQLEIGPKDRLSSWIRQLCGLFVSIVDDKIYLLHQTAAEFLVERVGDDDARGTLLKPDDSRFEWKHSLSPGLSNLILGSVCAQFLLLTDVADYVERYPRIGSRDLSDLDDEYSLLGYSVEHWATHLNDASSEKDLPWSNMLQLCSGGESACLVAWPGEEYTYSHAKSLSPLVVASVLGLGVVVRHLLKQESTDANERDPIFKLPPLTWAIRGGHRAVFDAFIEAETHYQKRKSHLQRLFRMCYVDFDVRNENSRSRSRSRSEAMYYAELRAPSTPLGWAVGLKEVHMVKKLLGNRRVTVGKEMLFRAAMDDSEDIFTALLATGQVRVKCQAENGRRLLNWALRHSAVRVAKYLLETDQFDIGTEMQPWPGELSAVAYAAKKGADELLRLLLATGQADVDFRNGDSKERTPLSFAAEAGAQECVRLLLATGQVEINNMGCSCRILIYDPDKGFEASPQWVHNGRGDTPLMYAAQNGHEGVVRLLLATGKADINTANPALLTPLAYAAESGHERVVQQLLAAGKAMANFRDSQGRIPLSYAAARGHEGVVRELLATSQATVDNRDAEGRTPLSYAAEQGHEGVVQRLLAACGSVADFRDSKGRMPLSYASENGHEAIVRDLLATSQATVDNRDIEGRTPVSYAAQGGYEEIVQRLLATGKVSINSMDAAGKTLLSHAAERGGDGVVQQLLATGEALVNSQDKLGRTPLHHAAETGRYMVVRELLATGEALVNSQDKLGRTPLHHAAERDSWVVVHQLLAMNADANAKDCDGQTPLFVAVSALSEACANQLLAVSNIDVNTKNTAGRTLLGLATRRGMERVVRKLLATGKVDVNASDRDSLTFLEDAPMGGSFRTADTLFDIRRDIATPDIITPNSYRATDRWVARFLDSD